MSESFSLDPVQRAAERYGDHLRHQREARALRMGNTGLLSTTAVTGARVTGHTFHGQHADSRG